VFGFPGGEGHWRVRELLHANP